jgi:CBS domain-containing protein
VLTRPDLLNPAHAEGTRLGELIRRPPKFIYADSTLRDAADHMVNHDIGRLPVVERERARVIGMVTRSDLLSAHRKRLREVQAEDPSLPLFSRRTADGVAR